MNDNIKVKVGGKKRHRFNLVDAIILLAIICASAALIYSFASEIGASADKKEIRYVLEVPVIQTDFCSKAAKDDIVCSFDTAQQIGTLTAVSSAQAYHMGTDASGNQISSEIQGYSVLYLTVEATASATDTGYSIGGVTVNIGRSLDVRLPGLFCNAECVSIEELS